VSRRRGWRTFSISACGAGRHTPGATNIDYWQARCPGAGVHNVAGGQLAPMLRSATMTSRHAIPMDDRLPMVALCRGESCRHDGGVGADQPINVQRPASMLLLMSRRPMMNIRAPPGSLALARRGMPGHKDKEPPFRVTCSTSPSGSTERTDSGRPALCDGARRVHLSVRGRHGRPSRGEGRSPPCFYRPRGCQAAATARVPDDRAPPQAAQDQSVVRTQALESQDDQVRHLPRTIRPTIPPLAVLHIDRWPSCCRRQRAGRAHAPGQIIRAGRIQPGG